MKIAIFGATGNIGRRIADEALRRGHHVTAITRYTAKVPDERLTGLKADVTDPAAVATAVKGHDAVISAVGPVSNAEGDQMLVRAARGLIEGLSAAGVRRLLIVGGAGSLEIAAGKQLLDSPDFPAAWKGVAMAHRDAFEILKSNKDLDWTYCSPAAWIQPGERTGKFRVGSDRLLTDAKGNSVISMEDFAILVLDELENPKAIRQRLTAAY